MADSRNALALVFSRNAFYRRMHFLALGALALAIIVIGVLIFVAIFLYRNPTRPLYFATDSVGRLIPVVPVSVPNMSTDEVTAWTIEAVESALSYDFVNYRTQLQNVQKFFTSYGWTTYMNALKASNNLIALTTNKMIFIAQVVEKPTLVTEGMLGDAYAWKFDMPVLVTYMQPPFDNSPNSKFSNPLRVTVIVQRQPILQSYRGLGILQFIAGMQVNVPNQMQEITTTPGSAG